MKKRTALIEMGKDGTFTIFTPDTQSTVFGDGDTVAKAKADFENTVKEVIEVFEDTGRRDPDDLKNTTFVYKSYEEVGTLSGDTPVDTGLSDGINVEITGGVSEGETIYYTSVEENSILAYME